MAHARRGIVTTYGQLELRTVPGVRVEKLSDYDALASFSGSTGLRALANLIEEATALKAELEEALG